jgi:hypothetical protein
MRKRKGEAKSLPFGSTTKLQIWCNGPNLGEFSGDCVNGSYIEAIQVLGN